MKTVAKILTFIVLISSGPFLISRAEAGIEHLELIRINSEFYPDQTYTLGLEVDSGARSIRALYYLDPYPDAKVRYRRFPLSTLGMPQVMIRAKDQYDVVKVSLNGNALTVYYRQDVREDTWRTKRFTLDCSSNLTGCSVIDIQKNRTITTAYISAHKVVFIGFIEKAVGIEAIDTR
ncbi:MAG: hypothetical protein EBX52_14485 [Proteobacteria bacterium]|nr:hypothetical protein [Pseudomonadota bacterium]